MGNGCGGSFLQPRPPTPKESGIEELKKSDPQEASWDGPAEGIHATQRLFLGDMEG